LLSSWEKLAFLVSPPCGRREPGSIYEPRGLAALRLELPPSPLTASKKGGEVSLSEITHQGTRQVPQRLTAMGKITRLVLWLCKKLTRQDLEDLVAQLQQVLAGREAELQLGDDFRQQHPHYRDFYVDPRAPLTQPPTAPAAALTLDWQQLCAEYLREHGRSPSPVRRRGAHPLPRTCQGEQP
jgi:hypothetical protein